MQTGGGEMSFAQGLLVFIIVSVGIIIWAFATAEEMNDHE
jgi:cbb3-type cytochrome oxidase subunit 3